MSQSCPDPPQREEGTGESDDRSECAASMNLRATAYCTTKLAEAGLPGMLAALK
jgi:hypothetical protein